MTQKRLVLFTSQDIGARLVEFVAGRSDVAPLVVTMVSEKDRLYGYRSTVEACRRTGVCHVVSPSVTAEVAAMIKDHAPDLILCAYYSARLPDAVLALCPAVNVHPGILPRYKGKFPTPWYILNGEPEFGIALHEMTAEIVGGNVLLQRTYPLTGRETGHELLLRTMQEAGNIIIENFDAILSGSLDPIPQQGEGSTYSHIDPRIQIDWTWTAEQIDRQVRVHAKPYFPAFSYVANRMILVNRVRVIEGAGEPGSIVESNGAGLIVQCGVGRVVLTDYEVAPSAVATEIRALLQPGLRLA